ncbi:MAG: restriction endonuclease subunit S [Rickettsiales bacterium]
MSLNFSKYTQHWQDKKLNELGSFQRGKSRHRPRNDPRLFLNGSYPLVQTGEIKEANLFIKNHKESYNDFGLAQSKLWPKNTLCITIAANIAETALLGYPMCFPDSVVGFNADPTESSEVFMHYLFTFIKRTIQNSATGSIQDNINIEYLTNLRLKIPHKNYQDKIVDILSVLDAKIELNNQINAELEKMAKTIYDYWFVQFDFPDANGKPYKSSGGKMVWNEELKREIPEGWEVLQLSNKLTFEKGVEPGTAQYKEKKESINHIKFIRVGDIENYSSIFVDNSQKKYATVNEKDVLVTFDGSVGKVAFGFEGAYSGGLRKIYDKSGIIDSSLIYFIFKDERLIKTIHKYATGSILLHAGASINNLKISFNEKKYLEFQNIIKPFFYKMMINKKQNQTLSELRDWLLPMLMNGQVKVE